MVEEVVQIIYEDKEMLILKILFAILSAAVCTMVIYFSVHLRDEDIRDVAEKMFRHNVKRYYKKLSKLKDNNKVPCFDCGAIVNKTEAIPFIVKDKKLCLEGFINTYYVCKDCFEAKKQIYIIEP